MVIVAGRGADTGGVFRLVHPGAGHAGGFLRNRRRPRRPAGWHGAGHGPVRGGIGDAIADAPYHCRARAGLPLLAHGGHARLDDPRFHPGPRRSGQRGCRAARRAACPPAACPVRARPAQRWHPHARHCHHRPGRCHCGSRLHVRGASRYVASAAPGIPAARRRAPGLASGEIPACGRGHWRHGLRVPAHRGPRRPPFGRDGPCHTRRALFALAYACPGSMDPRGRHRWG